MKRITLLALTSILFVASYSAAQRSIPTVEHFDYSTGRLTVNGLNWTAMNTVTDGFVNVVDGNLTYSGYPMSATGRMVRMVFTYNERVKLELAFGNSAGDQLYASFLINIEGQVGSLDQYFACIGGDLTTIVPRLYIRQSGGGFNLGLAKSSTTAITWLPTTYSLNTTYLVVMKVEIVSGTGNDICSLWINPDLSGPEPSPDAQISSGTDQTISGFFIRQVSNGTPNAYIDAIRIGNSWSESALPVQMINFSVSSNRLTANLKWATLTEVNNFGFDIERRRIGENDWQKISFVPGRGNANTPSEYTYSDNLEVAGKYAYRLKQINRDGSFEYFSGGEAEIGQTSKSLTLGKNYPNPFNPTTSVEFSVPEDGIALLKVFNMIGQEVATLFNAPARAGVIEKVSFDASGLPSGLYFSRLQFGNKMLVQKMLLAK